MDEGGAFSFDFGRDYRARRLLTAALLTEEEKWRFDKDGFLIIRQVVTGDRLAAVQHLVQEWLAIDDFDAHVSAPCVVRHRQEPYKTHFEHPQYGHRLFEEMNTDPEIIRVVTGLLQGCPRLFHSTLTSMTKAPPGADAGGFHRDDSGFRFPPGFRNPHND
eukprot:COSAG02_NODE_5275_length_4478_cov_2.390728_2_plen_161_part_00